MTLREYMDNHRLTQAQLGERVGVTRQCVAMWLRGSPPAKRLWPQLDALGIEYDRVYSARVLVPAATVALCRWDDPKRLIPTRLGRGVELEVLR
jgi:transcriptional regulator with XRE-family HTH domain